MALKSSHIDYLQIACDICDNHAPEVNPPENRYAIEAALQDGFSRIVFWTGLEYAVRFFCADCTKQGIADIRAAGKEPVIENFLA